MSAKTLPLDRCFQGFSRRTFTFLRDLGQDKPEPIRTWYPYKSFYLSCNRPIDDAILSPQFAGRLGKHFSLAAPLYRYIQRIAAQALGAQR